jgi:hypothetical protein
MSTVKDSNGETRWYGHYFGTVTDNVDADKLGRVRVRVPGLIEPESGWALPVGGSHSGGTSKIGTYAPPQVGAAVLLGFQDGDVDQPYFFGGWPGQNEESDTVAAASPSDAATKVQVHESARFLIVLTAIGGSEEVLIKDKVTGDFISMKPDQLKVNAAQKVTVISPMIELGADGIGLTPLIDGVVLGKGVDTFSGATYGALGSSSTVVTAKP